MFERNTTVLLASSNDFIHINQKTYALSIIIFALINPHLFATVKNNLQSHTVNKERDIIDYYSVTLEFHRLNINN